MAKNLRLIPREHDPEKARPSGHDPMGGRWLFPKKIMRKQEAGAR